MEIAERDIAASRLRVAITRLGNQAIRDAIANVTVRELQSLQPPSRVAIVRLRSSADPVHSILSAHFTSTLMYLGHRLSDECLRATRQALGKAADNPDREQLEKALVEVSGHFSDDMMAVMLASVAYGSAPAAKLCGELLAEHSRYGLEDVDVSGTSLRTDIVQNKRPQQRDNRRQQSERRSQRRRDPNPHRPWKKKPDQDGSSGSVEMITEEARSQDTAPPLTWRSPLLPVRYQRFDPDDRLAGSIVFADIPFTAEDPDHPDMSSKRRPCVVVAGSAKYLLVRPGYTGRYQTRNWRSIALRHWRAAGLTKQTWIAGSYKTVPRESAEFVGWLSVEDWNSLW